ncbi:hypothetical protein EDD86DRAFT_247611 [Gorgonomyces haynaldii]|nr:hypothetical protein EDD86DRAFT_247611 [Gorgonomyces haynaldii]
MDILTFDISKLQIHSQPLLTKDESQYLTDKRFIESLWIDFADLLKDSAIRPFLDFESSETKEHQDALIASSAMHCPSAKLDRELSESYARAHLQRFYQDLFTRIESFTIYDVAGQIILAQTILHLNIKSMVFWRIMLFSTMQSCKIPSDNHSLKTMFINTFWNCIMADVALASFLDQKPDLVFKGAEMPFAVPRSYCIDPTFPIERYTLGKTMQRHHVYVYTPIDLDIHGSSLILTLIESKIQELKCIKCDPDEFQYRLESIIYSLEDWSLQYQFQFPDESRIQSVVWTGLIEARHWGLYLRLLLPLFSKYLQETNLSKIKKERMGKCIQATRQISQTFRTFAVDYGIHFETIPPFLPFLLCHVGLALSLIQRHVKSDLILQTSKQDLAFVIHFLTDLSQRMNTVKIQLGIVLGDMSRLGLDPLDYQLSLSYPVLHRLSFF